MKIEQIPQCDPESVGEECDQNLFMKEEGLAYSPPVSLDHLQICYSFASDHPTGDLYHDDCVIQQLIQVIHFPVTMLSL